MDDVERQLRQALAKDPSHFGYATNLGVLLCQSGRHEEGIDWLRRAIAVQPQEATGHYNLGNALKLTGRLPEAIESYQAALARNPGYAAAYRNLANCLIDLGQPDAAAAANETATELRFAPGATPPENLGSRTTAGKLRHDIEQIEHLIAASRISPDYHRVADEYRSVLARIPSPQPGGHIVDLPPADRVSLSATYNRLWHKYAAPALPGGALDPALDTTAIEADYTRNQPGITHFDGFLKPEALTELRRFCLESTVWFQFKYANGYLGAFWEAGFWCPLLAQIAAELPRALPGIFHQHTLRKCWAFKYDSRLSGIPMHADFAAINVNFWISPDSANRAPDGGGLVVWDKEAPADWDFAAYNSNDRAMRAFLAENAARPVRVPHRQNRAVVFNSDLFHETDRIDFADGYENRRINITLLYGTRAAARR